MDSYSAPLFLHIKQTSQGIVTTGDTSGIRGHQIRTPNRPKIDGVFVEWGWDHQVLHVRNDRYGFYSPFYFTHANDIAISDSIELLLLAGAPRELNDAGLAAFLRLGHFLGDDTAFRSIRMLAPDAHLEWRPGKLHIVSDITIAPRQEMSRQDAMDMYVELFRASIARSGAPERALIVPLSGGRDSRHIVFELCRQGIVPDECITAQSLPGVAYKTEVETAGKVCDALGIPHRTPFNLNLPPNIARTV
jgi:asparagine synthase (glutamine-hydrolysing)